MACLAVVCHKYDSRRHYSGNLKELNKIQNEGIDQEDLAYSLEDLCTLPKNAYISV